MLILVNPNAHGGKAAARWAALAPALSARSPHTAVITADAAEARRAALGAAEAGERLIVSASGDGGVHLLVNALMDPATDRPRWPVALGAIGLGSSNDFHKPRAAERDLDGVPVALDPTRGGLVDLGRADWIGADGAPAMAYFVLNSSLGAVAQGNARYNAPTGVLAWLKARHVGLAIQWSSLEAVARFANVPGRFVVDGEAVSLHALTNLGVLKRVHFAGDMRYDTPVTPTDGLFDVNLCADMTRFEFVKAILAISAGRFLGLPKTRHWRASEARFVSEAPTPLELDGEVHSVQSVQWRVVPRAIHLCG